MTLQSWMQIAITLLIAFLISIPAGRYLGRVFMERRTALDPVFDPIDNFIYGLTSRRLTSLPMDWKAYTLHMLATRPSAGSDQRPRRRSRFERSRRAAGQCS